MAEVSLVIKAANQKYDDVKINCDLSWTILDLKNHLSVHYPSKPKITEQRIIYSGHLLTDDQLIRSIIQMSSDITTSSVYTFHLVCPQQKPASNNNTSDNLNNNQKTSNESIPNSNMAADAFPTNQSLNQLSALGGPDITLMQESYQVLMNQYYQYMSYYILSAPPIDFASYAAFTNAYMQSFNPNAITNNLPGVGNVENTPNSSVNSVANNNVENDRVNLGNNNNNNNMINNQIDIANNNDDLMNRDWTDWMYSFSKAIVMLSIIYFYSSLNRLVLFVSIFFIIYFYKNLLNGIHHPNVAGVEEQPINRAGNNNNNNNNNNVNAANLQRREDSQPEHSENNANNNDNELAPDRDRYYSCLRFLWVFFTSLFTSLIPDPVPIN